MSPSTARPVAVAPADDQAVLAAAGVQKRYRLQRSVLDRVRPGGNGLTLTALDGVDLELRRGEILALVGESGSGKSTLAKVLLGAEAPTAGSVWSDGVHLTAGRSAADTRRIQLVFQDPYSSLNARVSVGSMLKELLLLHKIVPRAQVREESVRLLNLVGLEADALEAYPSQFSGGQRQRIAIARALAVRPDVLVADEPVSALDVSVQATILELFSRLRAELGLSVLFVAHNLAVVQHLSDRVAVMYLGRIVEVGSTAEVFADPRHPYTRALIDSIPRMGADSAIERRAIPGEPPSPINLPTGCRFHPRCADAVAECTTLDPELRTVADGTVSERRSACLRRDELPRYTALLPVRPHRRTDPDPSGPDSDDADPNDDSAGGWR